MRADQAHDAVRIGHQAFGGARHFEFEIESRVKPLPCAGVGRQTGQVMQDDKRRRPLAQQAIQPQQIIFGSGRMP